MVTCLVPHLRICKMKVCWVRAMITTCNRQSLTRAAAEKRRVSLKGTRRLSCLWKRKKWWLKLRLNTFLVEGLVGNQQTTTLQLWIGRATSCTKSVNKMTKTYYSTRVSRRLARQRSQVVLKWDKLRLWKWISLDQHQEITTNLTLANLKKPWIPL